MQARCRDGKDKMASRRVVASESLGAKAEGNGQWVMVSNDCRDVACFGVLVRASSVMEEMAKGVPEAEKGLGRLHRRCVEGWRAVGGLSESWALCLVAGRTDHQETMILAEANSSRPFSLPLSNHLHTQPILGFTVALNDMHCSMILPRIHQCGGGLLEESWRPPLHPQQIIQRICRTAGPSFCSNTK